MPKKLLFTVHLVLLFVCLHHYSTNGLVLKDQPSTTKAGSVYEKLLEDAVQNVRAQTEWLTANVTDIIEKLKITFSNQDSNDKTKNLNIDINNKNKDEMGTIDLMLAKVREQLSSIYKQLEMDQGVSKAASNVWEFVKEKFASMINNTFGRNATQLPSTFFNSMYDRTRNAYQYFKNRLSLPLKFINERLLNKLTDSDTDLQAKSLNISLDNLKEQSEKFYASVITPQVEENVMQRINSMWQQVYEEMSNVKTILSNKEQLSKALETLKANITDKSPESVKMIINELTKGGSNGTSNDLFGQIGDLVGNVMTQFGASQYRPAGSAFNVAVCESDDIECEYWKCVMDNIRNSPQIANLKTSSKILFDPELRHIFATNPDLLEAGCKSSNTPNFQCNLFRNLLQIVDNAATNVQRPTGAVTGNRNRGRAAHAGDNNGKLPTALQLQQQQQSTLDFEDFDNHARMRNRRGTDDYSDYYDNKPDKVNNLRTIHNGKGNNRGGRVGEPSSNLFGSTTNTGNGYQPRDCDAILLQKYTRRGTLRRRILLKTPAP
ncbi:hypothetical protein T11_15990 [Trichinella zimbabwensis]|uniref:Secreted protein n=1 Tax=Trichinella zimbabwensis TaxID=268475 RepID=A0A0V1HIV3_9BILA|nr:hypothetical protein T11_15990 [Trichinella zimbabwensis]